MSVKFTHRESTCPSDNLHCPPVFQSGNEKRLHARRVCACRNVGGCHVAVAQQLFDLHDVHAHSSFCQVIPSHAAHAVRGPRHSVSKGSTPVLSSQMPCHHKLEAYLDASITSAGIADDRKGPLFRAAIRRTKKLADHAMSRTDLCYMVRRAACTRCRHWNVHRLPHLPRNRHH